MSRILFVTGRRASFIEVDRDLRSRRFEVHELHQPGNARTAALNGLVDRPLHGR